MLMVTHTPNRRTRAAAAVVGVLLTIVAGATPALAVSAWSFTANMTNVRVHHVAVSLPNGNVLVIGGYGTDDSSAEIYDATTRVWTSAGHMSQRRGEFTAALLQNGKILVAGGYDGVTGAFLAESELYDPASNTWSQAASMNRARTAHTATTLPSGRVLVVGGTEGPVAASTAEIYDPDSDSWSFASAPFHFRVAHTATLLTDGRVLVAGGGGFTFVSNSAEIYDEITNTWAPTAGMSVPRQMHVAVRLRGGRVLVAGGNDGIGGHGFASAEVFDLSANQWTLAGGMSSARDQFAGILLLDGRVLASGGQSDGAILPSADLYDPSANNWTQTADMLAPRANFTLSGLPSSEVLAAGGTNGSATLGSAELGRTINGSGPRFTYTIVNGHVLKGQEEKWVRFVGKEIVSQLPGSRDEQILVAARASWWGLKEGVFALGNPHKHSVCNVLLPNGKSKDIRFKPLETCSPGRAWQVGLAGVQVPNFSDQEVSAVVSSLQPGRTENDILVEVVNLAKFNPSQGTGAAIVASTGVLKKSWLLRHPAVGLTLVERNVTAECIDPVTPPSYCYGTGWLQTRKYAPTPDAIQQSVSDLRDIFDELAP